MKTTTKDLIKGVFNLFDFQNDGKVFAQAANSFL